MFFFLQYSTEDNNIIEVTLLYNFFKKRFSFFQFDFTFVGIVLAKRFLSNVSK